MAKQEVSAVQVQLAASAGLKLLQQDDLPVPMQVAKSGALSILEGVLSALANGEVVLANPESVENISGGSADSSVGSTGASAGNGEGASNEE